MVLAGAPSSKPLTTLNPNQIRGFWAAWGGWALDGMDASIYALVLFPALTDLLPRSGVAATPGTIGYYGSVLLAPFLFGWGLSMVWGPVADRFGRVRALMLTILWYSLFRFLCGLATRLYFALMGTSIAYAFGYIFYMPRALQSFFMMVFLLGVGGANFAMYTLWIPELYTTECRASAIGFTSSVGRFVGCGMVFLVGAGIARFGSLGTPVALTSIAFLLGLLVLPFADETRGKPLPI